MLIWRILLFTAIWAVLIYFLVHSVDQLPTLDEWAAFTERGALPGAASFAMWFVLAMALRAWRFGILVRRIALVSWYRIALAFPWLFMIGAVTPFRLGDIARATWVQRQGGSGATTIGLWVAERATDMLALLCFCLAGVLLAPTAGLNQAVLGALLSGVGLGYLFLWLAQDKLHATASRLPIIGKTCGRIIDGFRYMQDMSLHLTVLALSLAIWFCMAMGFWNGLSLALGVDVSIAAALICVGGINLAALISAAPGNIGSFQAAVVAGLGLYGIPAAQALMAGTALQGAGLATTLLLGLLMRVLIFFEQRRAGRCHIN